MKNSLTDLHNILFEQIERLADDELMEDTERARNERARAKAMSGIASQIINGAKLALNAKKYTDEYRISNEEMPEALQAPKQVKMIGGK